MKPKVGKMRACKVYLHKSLSEIMDELAEYEGQEMSALARSLLEEAAPRRLQEHHKRLAYRERFKQESPG